jgi:hypothetical protein
MSVNSEKPYLAATHLAIPISESLALRIYANTDPQNTKIADLQKGLILLFNGKSVVGEGTGFGVPIVKYSDETVFSGSSTVHVRKHGEIFEIRKEFFMDLIIRDRFRNFKLENQQIRALFDEISLLYQKHKHFARSILMLKGLLFKFGIKSSFMRSPHKGTVIVIYIIGRNRIQVKSDFSLLERANLDKFFVLNEQGAHFFRTYLDSESVRLVDEEIGVWNDVTAQSAEILNEQNKIGFRLKSTDGVKLRRGRELMKGYLDWAGLDYELGLEHCQFEYEIELFG